MIMGPAGGRSFHLTLDRWALSHPAVTYPALQPAPASCAALELHLDSGGRGLVPGGRGWGGNDLPPRGRHGHSEGNEFQRRKNTHACTHTRSELRP